MSFTYFDDTFTGSAGGSITGSTPSPVRNGSDTWVDLTSQGLGVMLFKAGGGCTSGTLSGGSAFAGQPLTGAIQDQVCTFTVSSASAAVLVDIQIHRDDTGDNTLGITLDYPAGQIHIVKVAGGATTSMASPGEALAAGTTYTVQAITLGGSLTVKLDGTAIATGLAIPTGTATNILIGQSGGSAGDVTFHEVQVQQNSTIAAGTATAGSTTSSTAAASATDATDGTAPYTYQWYRSTTSGVTGSAVAGAMGLTLADSGLSASTTYYYTLEYTDSAGGIAFSNQFAETTAGSDGSPSFSLAITPGSQGLTQGSTASYTVTAAPSGGFSSAVALSASGLPSGVTGSFSPASIAGGSGTSTLTLTASGSAAIGPATFTVTGTGGGVTSSATAAVDVATPSPGNAITFDDARVFLSPAVWRRPGDGSAWLQTGGGYFVVNVSGTTQLTLGLDSSINAALAATERPAFKVTVDAGVPSSLQSGPSNTLTIASGLSAGSHSIRVDGLGAYQQAGDGWTTSVYSTHLTGLSIDSGGTFAAYGPTRTKRAFFLGDSYLESFSGAAVDPTNQPYYQYVDYTRSWAVAVAEAIGAEFGVMGGGGTGWTVGNSSGGLPPGPSYAFNYDSAHPRALGSLDYLFVAWGINDHGAAPSAISSAVRSFLAAARAKVQQTTEIVLVTPAGGESSDLTSGGSSTAARDGIIAGAAAYKASSGDEFVRVADLPVDLFKYFNFAGSATSYSLDGIHPTWDQGHALIAGSVGERLASTASGSGADDPWATVLAEGGYAPGTAGAIVLGNLNVPVSTRSTLSGPAGFSALSIVNGKVQIDLTQLLTLRDQTTVTAPQLGDALAASHAAATGKEVKPNTPGTTTGILYHADGSICRTFTYDSGTAPGQRS